jgi:hypothetical protein
MGRPISFYAAYTLRARIPELMRPLSRHYSHLMFDYRAEVKTVGYETMVRGRGGVGLVAVFDA